MDMIKSPAASQDSHSINKDAPTHLCFQLLRGKDPVFFLPHIPHYENAYLRIWGYEYAGPGIATFPAFPPFGSIIVDDLHKVFQDLTLSDAAVEQLARCKAADQGVKDNKLPEDLQDLEFKYTPYEHQYEGMVRAFWWPRTGLFYHPGLGKTKVIVDLLRLLQKAGEPITTLVLCPSPNLVTTWLREIQKHGLGSISGIGMASATGGSMVAKRRQKILTEHWKAANDPDRPQVVIMSYGTMISDFAQVSKIPWDVVVMDESHLLKTPDSQRTNHVLRLVQSARRYELTGTPSQGDPRHVYGQLTVAAPFLTGGNAWKFTRRYCIQEPLFRCVKCKKIVGPVVEKVNGIVKKSPPTSCRTCLVEVRKTVVAELQDKFGDNYAHELFVEKYEEAKVLMAPVKFSKINQVTGYKNLHVLKRIVEYFALRKRQEDCLDLPERVIEDVYYTLDSDSKKAYNDLIKHGYTGSTKGGLLSLKHKHTLITKLLQILSGFMMMKGFEAKNVAGEDGVDAELKMGKIETLLKQPKIAILTDLLDAILADPKNKVIVWGQFSEELAVIERLLKKLKIGHVVVRGNTTNRTALQDEFNNDPDCRVYLSQMQTGIGVTLNSANYTIYAGWTYDLQSYQQSLERNYRLGQKRKVHVYRLMVENSLHEFLAAVLEFKEGLGEAMTSSSPCPLCKNVKTCLLEKIRPFTPQCVVCPDETLKPVTQPQLIP